MVATQLGSGRDTGSGVDPARVERMRVPADHRRRRNRRITATVAASLLTAIALVTGATVLVHVLRNRPTPPGCTVSVGSNVYRIDLDQAQNADDDRRHRTRAPLTGSCSDGRWLVAAMQESNLHNLSYGDRDSLGLFQQRPSQGWGSAPQLLTPSYAATRSDHVLTRVPDWRDLPVTVAARARATQCRARCVRETGAAGPYPRGSCSLANRSRRSRCRYTVARTSQPARSYTPALAARPASRPRHRLARRTGVDGRGVARRSRVRLPHRRGVVARSALDRGERRVAPRPDERRPNERRRHPRRASRRNRLAITEAARARRSVVRHPDDGRAAREARGRPAEWRVVSEHAAVGGHEPVAAPLVVMPTIGDTRCMLPVEPWNVASPNAKMPPSDATDQYPLPDGVAAIPTIGRLRCLPPIEPWNFASPNEKMPPSDATSQ